jgi:hypothetical protein
MTAAEQWCDERGIDEMRLHNSSRSPSARQSWSALGFEVVEEVRSRAVHPRRRTPPVTRAHAEAR